MLRAGRGELGKPVGINPDERPREPERLEEAARLVERLDCMDCESTLPVREPDF